MTKLQIVCYTSIIWMSLAGPVEGAFGEDYVQTFKSMREQNNSKTFKQHMAKYNESIKGLTKDSESVIVVPRVKNNKGRKIPKYCSTKERTK